MGACRPSPAGHRGLAVGGGGRSPTEQAERSPSMWKAACAPPVRAPVAAGWGRGGAHGVSEAPGPPARRPRGCHSQASLN